MEELAKSLRDKLSKSLSEKGNFLYYVMVNNRIMTVGRDSIFCRYNRERGVEVPLEFGHKERVNEFSKFVKSDSDERKIFQSILNTNFGGVDFSEKRDSLDIKIEYNDNLRIISITQNLFNSLLDRIYIKADQGSIAVGGKQLSATEQKDVYNYFDSTSIADYCSLVDRRLSGVIDRNPCFKFYSIFKAYQPVFVRGKCIFNPFLEARINKELVTESELYLIASNHRVTTRSGDLEVLFATDTKISKALGFSKPVRTDPLFLSGLLGGFFQDNRPNSRVKLYTSKDDSTIKLTEEAYISLPIEERQNYTGGDSLSSWCRFLCKKTGCRNAGELYAIVKDARL